MSAARQSAPEPRGAMPTHAEKRVVPYSADADVRADRRRRPLSGVPALVRRRADPRARRRCRTATGEVMEADLVISFKVYRERFGSRVTLRPDGADDRRRVSRRAVPLPAEPLALRCRAAPDACEVDFFVDFEFRSAILQKLIGLVFHEAMHRIVRAFEKRAEALYGRAARTRLKRAARAPSRRSARRTRPRGRAAPKSRRSAAGPVGGRGGEPDQALGLAPPRRRARRRR